jgi:fission process protein 1
MAKLSEDELNVLVDIFGKDGEKELSEDMIKDIMKTLRDKPMSEIDARLIPILIKLEMVGQDGTLHSHKIDQLVKQITDHHEGLRLAGYTGALARIVRYLAFVSDFGEALRPVVKSSIVTATYVTSIGYCVGDVAFEAYKLHNNDYKTKSGDKMSLTQCVVERSIFQAFASILIPFGIIHTTVKIGRKICTRMGRFQRFGPSIMGLSIIPALPLYLDEPVEHAIEHVMAQYGPWARPATPHGAPPSSDKPHND